MRLHHVAWTAGIVGVPLSHYWLATKTEPFYSSIYCFLWWAYIFVVDLAVCRLRGTSLLRDRPKEFLFLTIWSVPVWMLFEAVNLRLHNWYYVMAPWSFSGGMIFQFLAFGTVLPGTFETMELFVGLIERFVPSRRLAGQPRLLSLNRLRVQWVIGVLMLALLLAFPRVCFCLAWGFAFFLTEPVCAWIRRNDKSQIGRSLLGQLVAGDYTRLVALLAAGFVCGGLWEAWNVTARTKWIYSVPFFDELKLGEMPVLGFLGFPPFALECYALVNFLSLLRGGRNWELSAAENRARPGMPKWGVAASALLLPVAIGLCSLGIIRENVASFAAPVDYYFEEELGVSGINALRRLDALEGDQFLKLAERPPEISTELFERMRRIVALSECRGIGIPNALALEKLHITNSKELAVQDAWALTQELRGQGRRVRLEEVRIWIRAAKKHL